MDVSVAISVVTLVLSVSCSVFITGYRQGRRDQDIEHIKQSIADIRALFRLTLIDESAHKKGN